MNWLGDRLREVGVDLQDAEEDGDGQAEGHHATLGGGGKGVGGKGSGRRGGEGRRQERSENMMCDYR